MNNAREFLPQGKATAKLPIGLLPVEPQCRGGWLGGVFTAEVSQYSSSPGFVTKPDTMLLKL